MTLVERKSGYAVLAKVKNKTSGLVSGAILTKLKPPTPPVKTLTFGNGKEFAEHQRIDNALTSTTYLPIRLPAGNGDLTKTLMVYFVNISQKKRPLSTVTNEELRMIQAELNSRPRKRSGFKTPDEVFMQSLNRVALRI